MVEKLLQDLERAHAGLQHLHIEATKGNVAIIWDALTAMENANAFLESIKSRFEPVKENAVQSEVVKESEPDA